MFFGISFENAAMESLGQDPHVGFLDYVEVSSGDPVDLDPVFRPGTPTEHRVAGDLDRLGLLLAGKQRDSTGIWTGTILPHGLEVVLEHLEHVGTDVNAELGHDDPGLGCPLDEVLQVLPRRHLPEILQGQLVVAGEEIHDDRQEVVLIGFAIRRHRTRVEQGQQPDRFALLGQLAGGLEGQVSAQRPAPQQIGAVGLQRADGLRVVGRHFVGVVLGRADAVQAHRLESVDRPLGAQMFDQVSIAKHCPSGRVHHEQRPPAAFPPKRNQ